MTYTFYLRENANFSNGDNITAQDFIESWLRLLDPAMKAEFSAFFDIIKGAKAYRTGEISDPKEVGLSAESRFVLKIELEHPAAHFLKLLCRMSFVPINKDYYKDKGDAWSQQPTIIGNGPFYLYSRTETELVFKKNNL